MKKLFSFLILNFSFLILFGQAPDSFKYQAVVRDADGEIIANQQVGLQVSILQGSETGTAVYVETLSIETNQYGLVNLNIGEGTSADDFSAIGWGTDSYYIQIALDETGGTSYAVMGASQLLSVPYALYANQTGGSVESPWLTNGNGIYYGDGNVGVGTNSAITKFQIDGTGVDAEIPLFEVKNNVGEVVFAVYNEGIRMNVDYASTAHDRGGFVIGGQNQTKGLRDYFQVTPDSVRIYLEESAVPEGRGGLVIGGQNQTKAITGEYFFVNTDSTRITTSQEGGFGIASKTGAKTPGANYLNITPKTCLLVSKPEQTQPDFTTRFLVLKVVCKTPQVPTMSSLDTKAVAETKKVAKTFLSERNPVLTTNRQIMCLSVTNRVTTIWQAEAMCLWEKKQDLTIFREHKTYFWAKVPDLATKTERITFFLVSKVVT